jgi:hypothetical protein
MMNYWLKRRESREIRDFRKMISDRLDLAKALGFYDKEAVPPLPPIISFDSSGEPTNLLEILGDRPMKHWIGQLWGRTAKAYLTKDRAFTMCQVRYGDNGLMYDLREVVWGIVNIRHIDDGHSANILITPSDNSHKEQDFYIIKSSITQEVPLDESIIDERKKKSPQIRGCAIS